MMLEYNVEVIPGLRPPNISKDDGSHPWKPRDFDHFGVLLLDGHARAQWKNSRDPITRKRVCCKQSARFGDVVSMLLPPSLSHLVAKWRHKYLAPISGLATFSQPSTAIPVHYSQTTSFGQHSEETLYVCLPIAQSVDSCTAQQPGYWCT